MSGLNDLPFYKCNNIHLVVDVLQPHRDSPLILHELRRASVTGSTSGRPEGLKREAPGWRKSFGVLNRENTHVNEASLEKGRGVLCSALRWKLKARGVLERFPLLIRPYVRFLLGLLNPESIRGPCICQEPCKIPQIMLCWSQECPSVNKVQIKISALTAVSGIKRKAK